MLGGDDEFEFIRLTPEGRVHVLKDYFVPAIPGVKGMEEGDTASAFAELALVHRRALCGRHELEAKIIYFSGTSCFRDRELCQDCWRIVPEDQQHKLFEHEVPNPTLSPWV